MAFSGDWLDQDPVAQKLAQKLANKRNASGEVASTVAAADVTMTAHFDQRVSPSSSVLSESVSSTSNSKPSIHGRGEVACRSIDDYQSRGFVPMPEDAEMWDSIVDDSLGASVSRLDSDGSVSKATEPKALTPTLTNCEASNKFAQNEPRCELVSESKLELRTASKETVQSSSLGNLHYSADSTEELGMSPTQSRTFPAQGQYKPFRRNSRGLCELRDTPPPSDEQVKPSQVSHVSTVPGVDVSTTSMSKNRANYINPAQTDQRFVPEHTSPMMSPNSTSERSESATTVANLSRKRVTIKLPPSNMPKALRPYSPPPTGQVALKERSTSRADFHINLTDRPSARNQQRVFDQIDAMLRADKSALFRDGSSDFIKIEMGKAKIFMFKLWDMIDSSEISDPDYAEIERYTQRLQKYVESLDRHLPSTRFKLDLARADWLFMRPELLQPYDGDILHWPMFISTYMDLVDANSLISDCIKFQLLYTNIDQSTQQLLYGFDPAMPELQVVYQRLSDHFKNSYTIKSGLEKSVRKIPMIKNSLIAANWYTIRKPALLAKRLLTDVPEQREHERECVILLLSRMAPKHAEVYFNFPGADWSLNSFIAFVNRKIAKLEEFADLGAEIPTIDVSEDLCIFCKRDFHFPVRCTLSVDERKAVAKANGLCMRCLDVQYFHGHLCGVTCEHCQGDHNIALCYRYRPPNQFANNNAQQQQQQQRHRNQFKFDGKSQNHQVVASENSWQPASSSNTANPATEPLINVEAQSAESEQTNNLTQRE